MCFNRTHLLHFHTVSLICSRFSFFCSSSISASRTLQSCSASQRSLCLQRYWRLMTAIPEHRLRLWQRLFFPFVLSTLLLLSPPLPALRKVSLFYCGLTSPSVSVAFLSSQPWANWWISHICSCSRDYSLCVRVNYFFSYSGVQRPVQVCPWAQ